MNVKQMLLNPNKYSRPQTQLKQVTKIAIHYIGNPNTSAVANRNYFNNLANQKTTSIYASSHFIIGLDGEIIQCIPEWEKSYATNSANSYSISIECCHPDSSGKFNHKTLASLIELCTDLCTRYNLNPQEDLIRHYDVTGKKCPLWYVTNPSEWTAFKLLVYNKMKGSVIMDKSNRTIVMERFGLSESTMNFLEAYKFAEDLLKKLAEGK